eukprot:TRINITY_DN22544_c1_g1_i1.p1 TRINITY_DN22544_c1_g1~~TRINITY_DN22544_c1_g1_i1.p1  ORF type:complete len:182 (+),score=13.54 TRINITY_DN22544_c1_g1_i1:51-596(+)
MFVKMRVHIRPNILRSCNNCQRLGGLTCLGPRSSKQFVQKQRFVKVYSQVRSDILTASEEEEQIAFAGIRKQVTQRIQKLGEFVSPDPVTFSVLIQGYGQIDPPDWSSIASTLRNMESQFDLVPNVTVYNALLSVCVKSNDLQRAQDLLSQMDREGIQPDKTTEGTMSSRRAFRAALRKYL